MIKNWKTVAALAVLLAALGGLATWDEWQTKKDEQAKETANQLFATPLKTEDIVGFSLLNRGDADVGGDKTVTATDPTKTVEVAAKVIDGKWMLTHPVSDLADQQTIQDLIKNVLDYKYEKEITSGKDQWQQFGLNEPRRKVELETKDGTKTTLYVGINAPVGYSAYIATDKSDKVYAGSQYIATSTAKTLFDFRDKKILSINTADLNHVTFTKSGAKPLSLERADGKWLITSPEKVEADTTQVNNFLDDISGLRAADFVDTATKEQKDAFARNKLFASIRLTTAKGETQELLFATTKDEFYAAFDPNKRVIKLAGESKAKLNKSLDDLRNKKIFDFQSAQVEVVDVDQKEFVRVKDDWYAKDDAAKFDKDGKFSGAEAEKPTPKQNLRGLLVDLEYAKAETVLTADSDVVKKLPAAPKNRIKLGFATAIRPPLTIDIWQAGDNPDQIYVRPSGSSKVYKAKASIVASMNDAPKLPAEDATFPPPQPQN